jgi:hypothetical protein
MPDKFDAHTDVQGTAWVEPFSGITVDYEDDSTSYFVEPASGVNQGGFNQWTERFTPQTVSVQMKLARDVGLKMLVLEIWLPAVLLAAGLACLAQAGFGFLHPRPDRSLPGGPA